MPQLLGYYKDSKGKEPVDSDLRGNADLELIRIVNGKKEPPTVGRDSVTLTIYVRNEHRHAMELKPITPDPDLTIIEFPRFLKPDDMGKVVLSFKPSAERIDPLEGAWDFEKIVYAKKEEQQ